MVKSKFMTNRQFLNTVSKSLRKAYEGYLNDDGEKNTNKGTGKLKILHGAIANDLQKRLDNLSPNVYTVISQRESKKDVKSEDSSEESVPGRYFDKNIDITVKKGEKYIAAFELKEPNFDFTKNSVNSFESLLGNTANVRSGGADIMYFHIDIFQRITPKRRGELLTGYDKVNKDRLEKYKKLSYDSTSQFLHVPQKSLLYLVDLNNLTIDFYPKDTTARKKFEAKNGKLFPKSFKIPSYFRISTDNSFDLKHFVEVGLFYNQKPLKYTKDFANVVLNESYSISQENFEDYGDGVVVNDYESFIAKVIYSILAR